MFLRSADRGFAAPNVVVFIVVICCSFATNVSAADWEEVFNPYRVLSLNLELAAADWDRVRIDQPSQSEAWVPEIAEASFWADGESPVRVTIRRKGESDIPLPEGDPQKVSLKIDINALVPGQKWRGLTKLSLENGGTDPLKEGFAWMAHRLASDMYGYEAGNAAWVKLHINGQFRGVFVNAEQRNEQFLRNHGHYKEGATWLYKVDGSSSLEVGTDHSPTYSHLCFAPFNSGPGGGGGGGGGCVQPNLEIDLPQWIDLRGFFTLAAVDAFVENADALFSHSGKNSYAVDFNPPYPRTRLYFPWDLDTTIRRGDQSIYGNEPYQTILLNHPWFGQVFEQRLRDLLAGPFSEAALHEVINRLEQAVGPAFDQDPYVYDGRSAEAFASLRQWVTKRVASVRGQLKRPYIDRPVFNQSGGEVVAGFLLMMTAPAGTIYYTLDGSDPRSPGGAISPNAFAYSGAVPVEKTTQVIARAFDGTLWSALPTTATFNIARYASPLRITEIMYHPNDDSVALGDEYEFIELKNTGNSALDVSGFSFDGISFVFPAQTAIAPGAFVVLVRNPIAFARRYPGVAYHGAFWGKLSDSGEKVRLRNSDGNTAISVEYDDDPPWTLSPDGLGHSLVLADINGDPDSPEVWRASTSVHGSPGADDPSPSFGHGVVINEVLPHADPPFEDAIELYNPTSAPIDLSGWYLSDDFNRTNAIAGYDLKKYRIANGTVLPAGGYVVFYQQQFMDQNAGVPFGLSEFGETVYLASASNGNLTGLIIGAQFGASEQNVSVGRHRTSAGMDFSVLQTPTFGENNPTSLAEFRSGKGSPNSMPKVGPVVINEIMYNAKPGGSEFVELLNITSEPMDISGWNVAGAAFTFPPQTIVPPNGLLLLVDTNFGTVQQFRLSNNVPTGIPAFGHSFVLENEGEALRLEKPNTSALEPFIEMERVRYNDKSPWPTEADGEGPSLEKFSESDYGNEPVNWRTVQDGGSPGRLNSFPLGIAIARGSSWKYNGEGGELGIAWRMVDYSDSSWLRGDGALGYSVVDLTTPLYLSATSKPITAWFRKEFVINDPIAAIRDLQLLARFDDGFIVYLNGEEVLRSTSMPGGAVRADTLAGGYSSLGYEMFELSGAISKLVSGRNVLAVELHQESSDSADAVWDASLTYQVSSSPTLAAPVIDPSGGNFISPVVVTITNVTPDTSIYFTIDGTSPDSSSQRYSSPLTLSGSVQLKARAYKAGFNESPVASAEFTFVAVNEDTDGDGLPDAWEVQYFNNSVSADPAVDSDGDGLSNLEEYRAGTNPLAAASTLKILTVRATTEQVTIQWTSTTNTVYEVERCQLGRPAESSLSQVLVSGLVATPPMNSYSIPLGPGPAFYRIRAMR